jgi:3-vinyl bacteriochlorophyllide hydratase
VHRRTASDQDFSGDSASSPAIRYPRSASHHRDNTLSNILYSESVDSDAATANGRSRAVSGAERNQSQRQDVKLLYTPEERVRRDATKWTLVQGILAPVQFLIFLVSLGLVLRYLWNGDGFAIATASVVIKTLVLYTIMITGSIWEREVFGVYLFAHAFFWEDVFSFLVLTLHTAYLVMLFAGLGDPQQQMLVALAAYASYVINATQFVLKLRAARRDERIVAAMTAPSVTGSQA